jgi:hypothetical protein
MKMKSKVLMAHFTGEMLYLILPRAEATGILE